MLRYVNGTDLTRDEITVVKSVYGDKADDIFWIEANRFGFDDGDYCIDVRWDEEMLKVLSIEDDVIGQDDKIFGRVGCGSLG